MAKATKTKIEFRHAGKCGGPLDTRARKCRRCGKQWGLFSWLFDSSSIRPTRVEVPREPTTYASWAEGIPLVSSVVDHLPNWPRWARVMTVLVVLGVMGGLIWWLLN